MQHTIVLGCSQFTRYIPQSKRKAKIKRNQAGLFVFRKRFVFFRFTLEVNLGDKSGGVKTSLLNILFISVFIHKV